LPSREAATDVPHARDSDVGGHHLAFYVDDMHKAVAYLKSKGVRSGGAAARLSYRHPAVDGS
jgi:catechol 2,3-dioxygenase-like lactoylglutathione lyase family enzyme